jgi:phosphate/sulfate permease
MATSIATGALRPKVAVAIAGALNLVGAFLSVEVAKTISSGLVDETRITPVVIFDGLVGAILWNLLTWLFGLPSSSSHALFGGLIRGLDLADPLAQRLDDPPAAEVSAERDGQPGRQGFAAETSSAAVILTSSHLGFALSTTQVATGSIFGAGAGRKLASVQWGVAGQMAIAWLLTLPAAAAVGAVAAWLADTGVVGTIIVALVAVAVAAGNYAASRRRPITADNVNDVPAPTPVGAGA